MYNNKLSQGYWELKFSSKHLKYESSLMSQIILASTSEYRRSLLSRLSLKFTCVAPQTDEYALPDEAPTGTAIRLAESKACSIAKRYPEAVVIGADQIADLEGKPINKPVSHDRAVAQLLFQSGKLVKFHSAIAVAQMDPSGELLHKSCINTTDVHFKDLNESQIQAYLATEKPYDCAGSFKVEGLGISLFESVKTTDPTSLVGLPLIDLCKLLTHFNIDII
jgi:septum formation protein